MVETAKGLQRPALAVVLALLAMLPFLAGAVGLDYAVGVASRILIFGLVALSLNLILGFGGMVSFGHAAYFGAGAYTVAILSHHQFTGEPLLDWPLVLEGTQSAWLAWPLAMIVSGLLALLIGALCLRTGGLYFIMITLAFAQMLFFFFVSLESYGGDDGLSLWSRNAMAPVDLSDDRQFYYVTLAIVLIALFLKRRLLQARFGLVLQGIRDNEPRMQALGFDTWRYKLVAFVIAGSTAGLAGALIANQTEFVSPAFLAWTVSGEILVMVVLGGMGSLYGPLLGAAAFLLLEELLSAWTEHWMIVLGPILLIVVLFGRQGLWGLISKGARRHG